MLCGVSGLAAELRRDLERRFVDHEHAILFVRAVERGEDRTRRVGDCCDSRFVDTRVGRVGPLRGADVAAAGEIVVVESGGGF